jgi:hypothetical protein
LPHQDPDQFPYLFRQITNQNARIDITLAMDWGRVFGQRLRRGLADHIDERDRFG